MIELLNNQYFYYLLIINIIAALGMNVVYSTGQLNLGQAGFMAIGAYTIAFVDNTIDCSLIMSLFICVAISCMVAYVIALGTIRVQGIYFLMATLAIGEVIRVLISNCGFLGGIQGYSGIKQISLLDSLLILIFVVFCAGILEVSSLGIRMRAVFDDEIAASASGISVKRVKIFSAVCGAGIVSVAGAIFAKWLLFIAPRNFGINLSFQIAIFTLIGGVHSQLGAIMGATFITYLLEVFRVIGSENTLPEWIKAFSQWRQVIVGIVVIVLMAKSPEGIISRKVSLNITKSIRSLQILIYSFSANFRNFFLKKPTISKGGNRALSISELSHRFGNIIALSDITLSLDNGEILAVIGANGSGKTTLVNVVGGQLPIQSGNINLFRTNISNYSPDDRVTAGISRTFQATKVFQHLTVREHIQLGKLASNRGSLFSIQEVLSMIGLSSKIDYLPYQISIAEQRKLEIGKVLASSPHILCLDEPMAGMNFEEQEDICGIIKEINEKGITIILIEHNTDIVFEMADRIAFLELGKLEFLGTTDSAMANSILHKKYFGNQNNIQ